MTLRQWALGCLNSGLKQASKLALAIFTAYSIGTKLDVHTLAITVSVGFLWGVVEFVSANPVPDAPVTMISLPPNPTLKPDALRPVDLKDK